MKIISSFIFILSSILTCSQIQNTFIKDTTRASNGSFLTDSIITNKVLFKDINVENVYKAIRREDCPVRFAARVCCEIKKVSITGITYEISFPVACITRNDTCSFFYSSKLRKSKKKEYSDWLKKLDRKHSKFYIYNEESYKHLLDKATMDKIILTICKRYERDLYYSFEWTNIIEDWKSYWINYWPVPLEVESVYDSNEEY